MADIITRLLLKTNDFDANLEKSKQSVGSFQSGISNMASTAGAGIAKFAGGIGLAMGAFEAFDKLVHSSQSTQDAFEWNMAACRESVDAFFHSLSSGDFTAFNQGIAVTYDNMLKLQQLRDDFADAKVSNNVFRAQYQSRSMELKAIISDNTATKREKQKAANELKKITESYAKQLTSTNDLNVSQMLQNAHAKTGRYYSKEDIIRFFKVYNNPASIDERKGSFDSYASKMGALKKKEYRYEVMNTSVGAVTQKIANPEVQKQIRQLQKENNELDRMYLLSQHTDKTWEELSSSVVEYFTMQGEAAQNLNFLVKQQNKTDKSIGGTDSSEKPEKDSIAWYDAEIAKLNKKLSGTADALERKTIKKSINELENKKFEVQIESSEGGLAGINLQLSDLNRRLINETDLQMCGTIQAAINELEQRKINLKFVVDQEAFKIGHGAMKDGALPMPIKPTYNDKVPTHGEGGKGFKLPKYEPAFKKDDVKLNQDYAESLSAIGGVMSALNGVTNESAAAYLQWGANVIGSIAQAIPAITKLIGAKKAEAVANGITSATETPVVGWLLAGAAAISVIAAMSSIPKFATGGIVPGTSFTGDKVPALLNSGEMILNGSQQSNLFKMLNRGIYGNLSSGINESRAQYISQVRNIPPADQSERKIRLTGDFRVKGCDLELAIKNQTTKKSKVRR